MPVYQQVQGAYVELNDLLNLRFQVRDLQLTPRNPGRAPLAGNVRTRYRGRGMEFEEVRLYQPGDDIRNIDWRVTARTQVTHTKLFREERERPVIIMVDQRSSMFFGSQQCFKSVIAAHIGALLGWTALHHNDRVGALIFGDKQEKDIRPKRSRNTLLSILRTLSDFNQQLQSPIALPTATPLSQRLLDLRRIARPGHSVFIISDFSGLDEACDEQLYQLSRHGDMTLIHISDSIEQSLPKNASLLVSDGRTQRQLDTRQKDLRRHYLRAFESHSDRLRSLALGLALPLIPVQTHQAPLEVISQWFGKRR